MFVQITEPIIENGREVISPSDVAKVEIELRNYFIIMPLVGKAKARRVSKRICEQLSEDMEVLYG